MFVFARRFLHDEYYALLAVIIFALLPGVNSASLLVSKAGVVIFFTLFFLIISQKNELLAFVFLVFLSFVDRAFLLLSFALVFYGIYKKNTNLIGLSSFSFALGYYIFGFDFGARPRGSFIEIFGIYAAIFSPFVFFYYIYSLYWYLVKNKRTLPILWFVSFVVFVVSVILSMRQIIKMEDYGVFGVVGVPLLVQTFRHSYLVRLPIHRKNIRAFFVIIASSLIFITSLTFFNKPFYLFLDNPQKHFAYDFHFASPLAEYLKNHNIYAVIAPQTLQAQLAFYGIKRGGRLLATRPFAKSSPIKIPIIANKYMLYYIKN